MSSSSSNNQGQGMPQLEAELNHWIADTIDAHDQHATRHLVEEVTQLCSKWTSNRTLPSRVVVEILNRVERGLNRMPHTSNTRSLLLYNIANIYRKKRDYREACMYLSAALDDTETYLSSVINLKLAEVLSKLGRHEEAFGHASRAIAMLTTLPETNGHLSRSSSTSSTTAAHCVEPAVLWATAAAYDIIATELAHLGQIRDAVRAHLQAYECAVAAAGPHGHDTPAVRSYRHRYLMATLRLPEPASAKPTRGSPRCVNWLAPFARTKNVDSSRHSPRGNLERRSVGQRPSTTAGSRRDRTCSPQPRESPLVDRARQFDNFNVQVYDREDGVLIRAMEALSTHRTTVSGYVYISDGDLANLLSHYSGSHHYGAPTNDYKDTREFLRALCDSLTIKRSTTVAGKSLSITFQSPEVYRSLNILGRAKHRGLPGRTAAGSLTPRAPLGRRLHEMRRRRFHGAQASSQQQHVHSAMTNTKTYHDNDGFHGFCSGRGEPFLSAHYGEDKVYSQDGTADLFSSEVEGEEMSEASSSRFTSPHRGFSPTLPEAAPRMDPSRRPSGGRRLFANISGSGPKSARLLVPSSSGMVAANAAPRRANASRGPSGRSRTGGVTSLPTAYPDDQLVAMEEAPYWRQHRRPMDDSRGSAARGTGRILDRVSKIYRPTERPRPRSAFTNPQTGGTHQPRIQSSRSRPQSARRPASARSQPRPAAAADDPSDQIDRYMRSLVDGAGHDRLGNLTRPISSKSRKHRREYHQPATVEPGFVYDDPTEDPVLDSVEEILEDPQEVEEEALFTEEDLILEGPEDYRPQETENDTFSGRSSQECSDAALFEHLSYEVDDYP
ncbi:hypothetical protein FOZ63_028929, partial [Perkinsus olseni]